MTRRTPPAAASQSPATTPQSPGSGLPGRYTPRVAGYARGPFIDPVMVTPSDWRWRNARAYTITDRNGCDWRCVRVASEGVFVGYWAVEKIGIPLIAFEEVSGGSR